VRKWLSEVVGTALIVAAVVGSAFMANDLSDDSLLQLLVNAFATSLTLLVVISILAPISGAHFNPVVTIALALEKKISWRLVPGYVVAQLSGGFVGVSLANLMFTNNLFELSSKDRALTANYLGELIATSVLVAIILMAIEQSRVTALAYLVPAWIASAYFMTVSTSFANPAFTLARSFTDNFSGIDPESAAIFIFVQLIGGGLGVLAARFFSRK